MAQALTDRTPIDVSAEDWWRQAVVYQIYPRSFYDSNGDGLGDLNGITQQVPYLAQLGIDAVWLSPFYPSELKDGGYDVADYRDVSPQLGTLEDFDRMVEALHARGIKVIIDIVPNHTSDQHVWFQEALASPKGSRARDRYIFRDGVVGEDGELYEPSDWVPVFGGNVWEPVGDGQYYMHTFAVEQPDLNWSNPEVREEFEDILRFWSDRGVDGFRIDVAANLTKDMDMLRGPDPLPTAAEIEVMPKDGTHPLEDRDDVHDVYRAWRKIFNEYDPPRMAVAEAWVGDPHRRALYATEEELGQAFNFDLLREVWDADKFEKIIDRNLKEAKLSDSSNTWVLSNHDTVRHPTRYGLGELGEDENFQGQYWLLEGGDRAELELEQGNRRADAATLMILGLPGSTYLYQGEELGLHEVGDIADEHRQDPVFETFKGVEVGRDGCRVPLPWVAEEAGFGFGSEEPHFPMPEWFEAHAVDVQDEDELSTLNFYRRALSLRKKLLAEEELQWEDAPDGVLQFVRPGGWRVVMNFNDTPTRLPEGELLVSSQPTVDGELPGETTAWLLS